MMHLSRLVDRVAPTHSHWHLCRVMLLCLALLYQGCTNTPRAPDQAASTNDSAAKPITPEALEQYSQALATLENGDPATAEQALKTLAKAYPDSLPIQLNLAIAMYQQQRPDGAAAVVDKLAILHSENADVHHLRGLVAVENRDFREAESAFHQALKLDNKHALAHYNLALLYDLYFQDIRQAALHYEQYLQLRPDDTGTATWTAQLKRSLAE
jgi:tetratricopeptide (TPR) repeat protein